MIALSEEIYCYNCNNQTVLSLHDRLLRSEECAKCKVMLHCCKMCIFYDSKSYNECRESNAERVVDKDKANFCSYFKVQRGPRAQGTTKNDLLSAADALFKK
jgi:hypothetical protein